ncbi:type I methionyl aminopeptidase [Rhodoluna sp. KAS3]|uniref:type I methionyl aminopeptidase n=1 Tax=Rhodoluna sp. KAS3 TaxID=942880 RepID=UPI00223160B4|nr:type I methionyl aminopeptidase [Rhodoluna sp. KAS3]BDS48590.1 methionine aminopeptidase [Rhodoluna sp. KAS3]
MARHGFELKTPQQIIMMREAGLATAAALAAVRAAVRPGVTTLELDKIADDKIQELGGHSNFQLVPGYSHTICASINDEVVHGIPAANRMLQAGDILSVDCGAEIGEWNGDSAMTVIVPGAEESELIASRQKLSDVTEQSLWVGIAALAKAKELNEVGAAIEDYIVSQGDYGILEDYVGHGIGRSMHEDPPVYNYRVRGKSPKVVPGLVVAIEPMVVSGSAATKILSDGWTVSTKDASDASHWEHTVAVHEGGIWVLTAEDGGKSKLAPLGVVPVPLV